MMGFWPTPVWAANGRLSSSSIIFFSLLSANDRAENLGREILDLLRTDPDSASTAEQVPPSCPAALAKDRNSVILTETWRFFGISLCRPFPPHRGRPAGPQNGGVTNRRIAWKRLATEFGRSDW